MTGAVAVRACAAHQVQCWVDTRGRRDAIVCPAGHRLADGEWAVVNTDRWPSPEEYAARLIAAAKEAARVLVRKARDEAHRVLVTGRLLMRDGEKACAWCLVVKPLDDFHRAGNGNPQPHCKACHRERMRGWAQAKSKADPTYRERQRTAKREDYAEPAVAEATKERMRARWALAGAAVNKRKRDARRADALARLDVA